MALKTTTTQQTPRYLCSESPFFYARHDGVRVLARSKIEKGSLDSGSQIICADTEQEVTDEIKRLGLTPLA